MNEDTDRCVWNFAAGCRGARHTSKMIAAMYVSSVDLLSTICARI